MPYHTPMSRYEIVEKYYHANGDGVPFIVAIVDDPKENDTKIVIMFDEEDFTAVLSLDKLIESEDITSENNSYDGDKYDKALRHHLWNTGFDDDEEYVDDEDEYL
jgi:hypothetical protein